MDDSLSVKLQKPGQLLFRSPFSQEFEDGDGMFFAFDPDQVNFPKIKAIIEVLHGGGGDQDLRAIKFVQTLQTGGQVDVVPDGGVIKEAAATLSVLSEAWKRSQWALKEYFFSEETGTPVFLLKAKTLGPTLAIAGMPYIDFTSDDRGFEKLHRELRRKRL